MIETAMYVALGFLTASVIALLLSRPIWRRAVRLTTQRLEATLPMSRADMDADKDELRAQYAIKLRNFELALEKEKAKSTRYLVDRNKSRAAAQDLQQRLTDSKSILAEKDNQIRVMESHIRHRGGRTEDLVADEPIAAPIAASQSTMAELTARADAARTEPGSAESGRYEDIQPLKAENTRLRREAEALRNELAAARDMPTRDWDMLKAEVTDLADKILSGDAKPAPKAATAAVRKGMASTNVPKPKGTPPPPEPEVTKKTKPISANSGAKIRSRLGSLAQRLESLTESDRK